MSGEGSHLYYRGRVGLYHVLRLLGIGAGDEVILQAFTCVAVPEAILAAGATPIWADVAAGGVNMDPAELAARISPQTRAIIIQHTFGIPADFDGIISWAARLGIPVIEDCCHTAWSTHRGRLVGTVGQAAFWSYEWGKPAVAGVGGEVRFNDGALRSRAAVDYTASFKPAPIARSCAVAAQFLMYAAIYGPRRFWMVRRAYRALGRTGVAPASFNPVGSGSAIAPDFAWQMCGFTRSRLNRAKAVAVDFLAERKRQAGRYAASLAKTSVKFPAVPSSADVVYARFPIFVSEKERLLERAYAANLEVAAWFCSAVHPLEGRDLPVVGYVPGSCPRAEASARTLVSLPIGPKVTAAFQDDVVALLKAHCG